VAILRSQVVADLRGRARKQRIWKQISGCRSKRKAERHVVVDRITDYRLRGPLAASTDSYTCPIGTRGEIVGRILIGLGFVPIALTISYQAALAAPVYLNCQASGVLAVSRYLTIDYGTSTVVTSGLNVTTPTPDVEGRTAQPAQITDSEIAWHFVTKRPEGRSYTESYTLNRLNGGMTYFDQGTQHGESWTCQVGVRPAPKF
jgi:hypothetical protein